MFLAGTLIYILVIASYFIFDTVQSMINEAITLAPVITYAMLFLYSVPVVIHLVHISLRKAKIEDWIVLDKQTKLAASVSVSLGLIGTFQGLTSMVSSISGALGGEGDMAAQIAKMMSSVSSALAAMSYAFLTSILGVAISILLLLSLNFWQAYYTKTKKEEKNKDEHKTELELISLRLDSLSELCINLNKKLIVLSDNKDSTELALKELHDINIHLSNLVEMDRGLVEFQKETFLELKESTNVNNRLDNIIESIKNLSQEVSLSNDIVRKGVKNLQDASEEYYSIKNKIMKVMELVYGK
ncbi:hypothetical protein M0K47_004977 [Escherichia coli]|uniref:hypothetical protein n=1 Tax=Escherichia TaxID=561 RepID=UPI00069488F8|nr:MULTISPECIES: hypothetical protein [Escherichia]EIU7773804.1 hypothetical protein [Salmonella enterica]EGS5160191.1 hypothetical protein [Escherichia coli]EJM5548041.1 hypothetical protein [Salmonella enterica]EKX8151901.1 hypothetical protein [Escherichia coli]MBB7384183.1 hypothetical protein [Escherichia coli]